MNLRRVNSLDGRYVTTYGNTRKWKNLLGPKEGPYCELVYGFTYSFYEVNG
jgi:hypothetical protein